MWKVAHTLNVICHVWNRCQLSVVHLCDLQKCSLLNLSWWLGWHKHKPISEQGICCAAEIVMPSKWWLFALQRRVSFMLMFLWLHFTIRKSCIYKHWMIECNVHMFLCFCLVHLQAAQHMDIHQAQWKDVLVWLLLWLEVFLFNPSIDLIWEAIDLFNNLKLALSLFPSS